MRVDASRNGHNMTVVPGHTFTGTVKAYMFFCMTCDPEANNKICFDIVEGDADEAISRALAYGDSHSEKEAPNDFQ